MVTQSIVRNGIFMDLKSRKAVLFASRPVSETMKSYVSNDAFIAAADAGWEVSENLGFVPSLVVGDFDSSNAPPHINEVIRLHAEKDDTDTHYAAKELFRRGYNDIVILGALGGRMDHTFANFHTLLFLANKGIKAILADEESEIHCIAAGTQLILSSEKWKWLSVFAANGTAEGVYERGVKYPLEDGVLRSNMPLGVSNEFASDKAYIGCEKGCLYVMVNK